MLKKKPTVPSLKLARSRRLLYISSTSCILFETDGIVHKVWDCHLDDVSQTQSGWPNGHTGLLPLNAALSLKYPTREIKINAAKIQSEMKIVLWSTSKLKSIAHFKI